jgi:hypothetical protein
MNEKNYQSEIILFKTDDGLIKVDSTMTILGDNRQFDFL